MQRVHDAFVPGVLGLSKVLDGDIPGERSRALHLDGVVVEADLDSSPAQRVVTVTDGVDQRLPQRDGRVLRDLLPDQPADDRVPSHLVVDPLIGLGDKHREGTVELAPVTEAGPAVDRPLEPGDDDPESAVPALRITPEHEQRGQSYLAIGGEQAKVPGGGGQVDS